MTNTEISDQPTAAERANPRHGRRWVKVVLVLLLLIGAGSAAAFHFLKEEIKKQKIVDYDEPDVEKAAAKEEAALTEVEKNQKALKEAQTAYDQLEKAWETAKKNRDDAYSVFEDAPESDRANAEANFHSREQQFAKATKELDDARVRLREAENKLKSADELRAEAEAERKSAEELAKKELAYHQALLGEWKREDDYGEMTMELHDDGTGLMVIDFNSTKAFLLGTKTLEVDIKWKVTGGDHVVFDSVSGRPEGTFKFISKIRGTHRDQVITNIDEDSYSVHDADNKDKRKTWTRIRE